MERKIYERLRTGTRKRLARKLPEDATARERQRVSSYGEGLDELTEFQLDQLEALLIEDEIISEMVRVIGQGKEANVYWVKDPAGRDQALKLFRMHTTSHKTAFSQRGDTGKLQYAEHLALQEYLNLTYAFDAGVKAPKPEGRKEFIFTMEFLGDESGPAPLLRNVDLVEIGVDPIDILEQILDEIHLLFNTAEMTHGDLSEHNLIWYKDQAWVIDLLQSQRWHPKFDTDERIRKREAIEILERDVKTILQYFRSKYRRSFDPAVVMDTLVEEKVDDIEPDELMSEYYGGDFYKKRF